MRKLYLSVILTGIVLLFNGCGGIDVDDDDNVETNPTIDWTANNITIKTAAELKEFSRRVNSDNGQERRSGFQNVVVTLANDIELNGGQDNQWSPIGQMQKNFYGTFDGNGKVIRGIYIVNTQSGVYGQGLFGHTNGATIKNLGVDVNITGNQWVGGLVGSMSNNSKIENCYATGNVSGSARVGGLAGSSANSNINKCYADAGVNGSSAGGLLGYNSSNNSTSGRITNCYAVGNVSGNTSGGLVGTMDNSGGITNCYAVGNVSGNTSGGLVGTKSGSDSWTVTNCYALTGGTNNFAANRTFANSGFKTQEELKQKDTYVWDFDEIWEISAEINNGYPYLQGVGIDK